MNHPSAGDSAVRRSCSCDEPPPLDPGDRPRGRGHHGRAGLVRSPGAGVNAFVGSRSRLGWLSRRRHGRLEPRQRLGARRERDGSLVDRQRGDRNEHGLRRNGPEATTRGDRGRRPDRNRLQRHDRVRREGRPGVGARALHLRVRGREDPRLGRKCPGRELQRHRGCGRQRSSGGRLSRARPGDGARRLHLPLRGRLPRRTRRCLRLELAPDQVERRLRRPQDPRLVQRVRDPGDRRPDLRHLRLAGPAQRERLRRPAGTWTSST